MVKSKTYSIPKNLRIKVRFLKEIGCYGLYKTARANTRPKEPIFNDVYSGFDIGEFIDKSLTWSDTGYRCLWRDIYEACHVNGIWNDASIICVLNDQNAIAEYKKIVYENS